MIFGITPEGFNRKLESDIVSEIVAESAPIFGVDPASTDWPNTNSPLSQLIMPFARQLGLVWELIEASFEGIDPSQAFGTMLDGLLALSNISRLEAKASSALVAISGVEGTIVPADTRISVFGSGQLFAAEADAIITKASLLRFNVKVATVASTGTPYEITLNANVISSGVLTGTPTKDSIAMQLINEVNASVLVNSVVEAVLYGQANIEVIVSSSFAAYPIDINGTTITFTSGGFASSADIRDGLIAAINAAQSSVVAAEVAPSVFSIVSRTAGGDWLLGAMSVKLAVESLVPEGAFAVKASDLHTVFSGDVDARMDIDRIFSPQTYLSVENGPIEAPAGTLTNIETQVTGLDQATNFLDAVIGANVETDDAARIRREQTLATGSGSMAAILSALYREIDGLTVARAYDNNLDTTDAEGRPPHSVEVLAIGGTDLDIAQVIWATRAAGIQPYGNINADGTIDPDGDGTGITIKDSNGTDQIVHFSRPQPLYAWVTAIKTLYSEEDFPTNGDEAIRQAILEFGNRLGIGKDFLLQRFVGPVVSVPGVGRVDLRIAVSNDPDTAPSGYPSTPDAATWQVDIAVSPRQVLVFDSSRIAVS